MKMSDIVEGGTVMGEANASFSCETRQCSFWVCEFSHLGLGHGPASACGVAASEVSD